MTLTADWTALLALAVVLLALLLSATSARAQVEPKPFHDFAPTPPMGWNSWDSYGSSVRESEVRANAEWMAEHLKQHGWQYVVVDIRWYVENPWNRPYNQENPVFSYDEFGRLTPPANRFPSAANGRGFKPLADDIHAMGLKFGVHLMRGMNKQIHAANLPIADSEFRTGDVEITDEGAPWLRDNYGLAKTPAAQAYYDSIFKLLAEWGVDYVKIDDLSRPYNEGEIEMIRNAIDKTGRPIVFSTSPGATPLAAGEHVANHANLWRITDDLWDKWEDVEVMFDRVHEWTPYRGKGHWPDADMLPLGRLAIRGERGEPNRQSNLTPDEQRTLMSLWCIARSPLMMGGDLPSISETDDELTRSLLTNPEVLAVNQQSTDNRQLLQEGETVVWVAAAPNEPEAAYVGLFNLGDTEREVAVAIADLNLGERVAVRDLWEQQEAGEADGALRWTLPAHGSALLKVTRTQP